MPIAILEEKTIKALEKQVDKVVADVEKAGMVILSASTTGVASEGEVIAYLCTVVWDIPLEEEDDDDDEGGDFDRN